MISKIVQEDQRLVGSLRKAAKQYSELKRDRAETAVKLYKTFLNKYIFNFEKDKHKVARANLSSIFIIFLRVPILHLYLQRA